MGPAHRFVAPAAGDEPSRVGAPAGMFRYDCVALGTRVTCALFRLLHSIRKSGGEIGVLVLLGTSRPAPSSCCAGSAVKDVPPASGLCRPGTGVRAPERWPEAARFDSARS